MEQLADCLFKVVGGVECILIQYQCVFFILSYMNSLYLSESASPIPHVNHNAVRGGDQEGYAYMCVHIHKFSSLLLYKNI